MWLWWEIPTRQINREWLYLFYATQIGSKKHDGVYHYEYDRIRAMRRLVANSGQAARQAK